MKFKRKIHFITLNYVSEYTLHSKLSECTLCTLNYYAYHTLHFGYHTSHSDVTLAVMFDRIILHVTNTCFLLRWNKLKRMKHPSSNLIKIKANFFHISLSHMCASSQIQILLKTSGPTHLNHRPKRRKKLKFSLKFTF